MLEFVEKDRLTNKSEQCFMHDLFLKFLRVDSFCSILSNVEFKLHNYLACRLDSSPNPVPPGTHF